MICFHFRRNMIKSNKYKTKRNKRKVLCSDSLFILCSYKNVYEIVCENIFHDNLIFDFSPEDYIWYFILYWQISCFEIDLDTKFKEHSKVLVLQLEFGFVLVLFACQPCQDLLCRKLLSCLGFIQYQREV